jgi:asparagine synthetase B (glutamine-hydrolysing)
VGVQKTVLGVFNRALSVMKPFHESLVERLLNYRAERKFSSKEWISKKIDLLNNYFLANSINLVCYSSSLYYVSFIELKACCISLSGGIDSAVVLALAKKVSFVILEESHI